MRVFMKPQEHKNHHHIFDFPFSLENEWRVKTRNEKRKIVESQKKQKKAPKEKQVIVPKHNASTADFSIHRKNTRKDSLILYFFLLFFFMLFDFNARKYFSILFFLFLFVRLPTWKEGIA